MNHWHLHEILVAILLHTATSDRSLKVDNPASEGPGRLRCGLREHTGGF